MKSLFKTLEIKKLLYLKKVRSNTKKVTPKEIIFLLFLTFKPIKYVVNIMQMNNKKYL